MSEAAPVVWPSSEVAEPEFPTRPKLMLSTGDVACLNLMPPICPSQFYVLPNYTTKQIDVIRHARFVTGAVLETLPTV